MYVYIHQDKKCSKCGVMNHTETVTRDMETFIRCIDCGHEKLISTLSVTPGDSSITSYDAKIPKEIEEF